MKAYIITLKQNLKNAERCIRSIEKTNSQLDPIIFDATTPLQIPDHMHDVFGKNIDWSWPVSPDQDHYDFATGVFKKHYVAADMTKKVACSLSHARLWKKCVDDNEEIVILEHDALFTSKFSLEDFSKGSKNFDKVGACSLNDPRGTTRKAKIYYEKLVGKNKDGIHIIPPIDSPDEPNYAHGFPGNSAYYIKPWAAKELLDKTLEVGLWPNDALICKQLFPWIRAACPFYTKVQGTVSTTVL
jgi:hypothetical protein